MNLSIVLVSILVVSVAALLVWRKWHKSSQVIGFTGELPVAPSRDSGAPTLDVPKYTVANESGPPSFAKSPKSSLPEQPKNIASGQDEHNLPNLFLPVTPDWQRPVQDNLRHKAEPIGPDFQFHVMRARMLVNEPEVQVYQMLEQLSPDLKLLVFPKVCLRDVFVETIKNPLPEVNRYAQMHVDFLLVEDEDYFPVGGIEVDGGYHSSKDQQERDFKKERVFDSADLPLLRLDSRHIASESSRNCIRSFLKQVSPVANGAPPVVRADLSASTGYERQPRLIDALEGNYHLNFVDKRAKRGPLWIIGDQNLRPTIDEINRIWRADFTYAPEGGRATNHKAAWYSHSKR